MVGCMVLAVIPSGPPSSPLAGARWPDPSAGMADSDSDDNVETLQYKVPGTGAKQTGTVHMGFTQMVCILLHFNFWSIF